MWLKIGGDKGGGSFKTNFQIVNVAAPNSVHNTCSKIIYNIRKKRESTRITSQKIETSTWETPTPEEGSPSSKERTQKGTRKSREKQSPRVTQLPNSPLLDCTLSIECTCVKCCCNTNLSRCDFDSLFSLRGCEVTNRNSWLNYQIAISTAIQSNY